MSLRMTQHKHSTEVSPIQIITNNFISYLASLRLYSHFDTQKKINGWCDPCVSGVAISDPILKKFLFVRHTIVRQMAQPGLRGQGWVVSVSVGPSGVCVKTLNEILKSIVVTDHAHGTI